ncbi:primase C-terminal domain-containing protein, partial [Streptococcus pneumoniae]|uniref:primase C-terminal domain-containing protein n=1 Tax=Streptococcus pneumoniae TaxID=1313 RepID=UPI001E362D7B
INETAKVFKKTKKTEKIIERKVLDTDDYQIFKNLLVWMANRGNAFVSGERNNFIFMLASSCCRFGIDEFTAENLISYEFL